VKITALFVTVYVNHVPRRERLPLVKPITVRELRDELRGEERDSCECGDCYECVDAAYYASL